MNDDRRAAIEQAGFTIDEHDDGAIILSRAVTLDDDSDRNGERLLAWVLQLIRAGAIASPQLLNGTTIHIDPIPEGIQIALKTRS